MLHTRHKIALARAAYKVIRGARSIVGKPSTGVFRRRGIRWSLDLAEGIDFSIYLLGAFEPRTVNAYQRFIKLGDTVLDIGANIGAHTLFFAKFVGDGGRVFGFEPTEWAFRKLRANLALNPELERRVDANHMFLVASDTDSRPPEIYSSWPLEERGNLHPKHLGQLQETGSAGAATLDSFLAARPDVEPRWIKIDVDGNELPVLRGAEGTLRRLKPGIIMELSPYTTREAGHEFADLVELLANCGYSFAELESGRPLSSDAAALEALVPDGASLNVLLTAGT
ncbi:MAG TPA: FkbM family methyltransferase [Opitutaceae bacterium]|nr:FkbM family methyltransferase [Opitutaceae bacterium]